MDNTRYSVVVCDTDKSKHINYQIRYQVYCIEKGYENVNQFPTLIETDCYDTFSVHFLIRDNENNRWIGACRLIILPFDELPLLQHSQIDDISLYKHFPASAEISRLCALAASRKGTWEMLALMLNVIHQYCLNNNLHHCFSFHNKAMARVVRSLNIHAQPISQDCEFHGKRRAYYHNFTPSPIKTADVDDLLYQPYSEYKKQHKFISNNNDKSDTHHAST